MKILFTKVALLFVLVTFTGCNFIDENFKDGPDLANLTGVLSVQEANDEYPGTHLLTDSSDELFPLRSTLINLGAAQYLGNKVELSGVLSSDDNVFNVTGVQVLEILSDVKVTLGKLSEYKNTDLGFEISYYDDWEVRVEKETVSFSSLEEDDSNVSLIVSQHPFKYEPVIDDEGNSDTPLEAYFASEGWLDNPAIAVSQHQLGIDKLPAWEIQSSSKLSDYVDHRYFLYRDTLIYEISFNSNDDLEDLFAQMLSGFRFIGFSMTEDVDVLDSTNTQDLPDIDLELTTFESLPYLFRGQYPSSWYYAGSAGSDNGVLRHYGFGDKPLDEGNEILSLDVISTDIPGSATSTIAGRDYVEIFSASGSYTVYSSIGNHNFRLSGPSEYQDLLIKMAASIYPLEEE
ncbi:MAG: hypothetical protein O3B47_00585 [bacterium]|nr:hypothetical protein [bacterium]